MFEIKKEIHNKAVVDVHKCIKGVGGDVGSSLICYLTAPQPTLAHYQGDSINHCIIQLQCHMEPHNKAGSLTPAEHLIRFEPEAFQFYHVLTH